ncbi:hypothetical protein MASR2M79_21960 [Aminivibrio sp.]
MKNNILLLQSEITAKDPLTELIRNGARDLIAKAVEAGLETLLGEYSLIALKTEERPLSATDIFPDELSNRDQRRR